MGLLVIFGGLDICMKSEWFSSAHCDNETNMNININMNLTVHMNIAMNINEYEYYFE